MYNMQGFMSYPPCKGAPNTIDLFDQSRLYRLDQPGNERATSTHKLVSFSGLMHRNEVIHDQEETSKCLEWGWVQETLTCRGVYHPEGTPCSPSPPAHSLCTPEDERERANSERT